MISWQGLPQWDLRILSEKNMEIKTVKEMMEMSLEEIRDYHNVMSDNATSAWHIKRIKEEMEKDGA